MAQGDAAGAVSAFEAALKYTDASMRSNIDEQLTAARRLQDEEAGGDAESATELGSSRGGGDGGGLGGFDFASLMSNPMVQQMAEQLAGGAGGEGGMDFNSLLSNPQLMQRASPLLGGAGGGMAGGGSGRSSASRPATASAPPAASPTPALPSLSAFLASPAAASMASDPDLAPVLADVRANGESALSRHMNNPKLLAKLSSIAAQMSASGSNR